MSGSSHTDRYPTHHYEDAIVRSSQAIMTMNERQTIWKKNLMYSHDF